MAGRKDDAIDDAPIETDELAFADEDERLPWLESGEDDEDGGEGVDSGRILGFALIGLLVIAVLVGAIYWFARQGPGGEQVADGSTIEAPEGPYKVRPDDPGGKTFEGTGNLAPAVGEGQTREGRLAREEAPKPSVDARRPGEPVEPQGEGGVAVQVGAYSTRESAVAGWSKLTGQTDKLQGVNHRIVEGRADIGTVYRLQAMAGDAAAARALCQALKSDGIPCQVKR